MRVFGVSCSIVLVYAVLITNSALAMVVGDAECPSNPTPDWHDPECCSVNYSCERSDGACTVTANGTPGITLGQTLNCHNCAGCPESQPPAMKCEQNLSVSFTEQVSVQVASGIQAGVPGLQATLNNSIGHSSQRTFNGGATCGTVSWPACKKADPAYRVSLSTTTGKSTEVVSNYRWVVTSTGECCSGTEYENAGTRTSTASGSEYNGGAQCESVEPGVTCVNGG